jgi:hypothetical protein
MSRFGERHHAFLNKTLPVFCPLPPLRPPKETVETLPDPPANVSLTDALKTPMGQS